MNAPYDPLVKALSDGGILDRFPYLADALWLACLQPSQPEEKREATESPTGSIDVSSETSEPVVLPPVPAPLAAATPSVRGPELRIKPLRIDLQGAEPDELKVVVPVPGPRPREGERVPAGPKIQVPSPVSLPERDRFLRQFKLLRRLHPSVRRRL